MNRRYFIKLSLYLLLIPSFLICAQKQKSLTTQDKKGFYTNDPLLQIQDGELEEIPLHSEQENIKDLQSKTERLEGTSFQMRRRNKKTFYSAFIAWVHKHFSLCNAYPVGTNEANLFMEMGSIADLAQEEAPFFPEPNPYYEKSPHSDEIF